jgi:hypothetical protein
VAVCFAPIAGNFIARIDFDNLGRFHLASRLPNQFAIIALPVSMVHFPAQCGW